MKTITMTSTTYDYNQFGVNKTHSRGKTQAIYHHIVEIKLITLFKRYCEIDSNFFKCPLPTIPILRREADLIQPI